MTKLRNEALKLIIDEANRIEDQFCRLVFNSNGIIILSIDGTLGLGNFHVT